MPTPTPHRRRGFEIMANFALHLAYPPPEAARRRLARPAAADHGPAGVLRRLVRAALRSIDEAPFDLAWPPSPRPATEWAARRLAQQEAERARHAAPGVVPHNAGADELEEDERPRRAA